MIFERRLTVGPSGIFPGRRNIVSPVPGSKPLPLRNPMRQGAGERPPAASEKPGWTRACPPRPARSRRSPSASNRPATSRAVRASASPKHQALSHPAGLPQLGAGARRDTRHRPASSVPSRPPDGPDRGARPDHTTVAQLDSGSRGATRRRVAPCLAGRTSGSPKCDVRPNPTGRPRLGSTACHQARDRPVRRAMRRTFATDRRSGLMNGPGARASSHDYATAQASATDWRQPPPTKPH